MLELVPRQVVTQVLVEVTELLDKDNLVALALTAHMTVHKLVLAVMVFLHLFLEHQQHMLVAEREDTITLVLQEEHAQGALEAEALRDQTGVASLHRKMVELTPAVVEVHLLTQASHLGVKVAQALL